MKFDVNFFCDKKKSVSNLVSLFLSQEENDVDAADMEEDIDGDLADLENLNYDDLDSVSKLQKTQRYIDIVQVS